MRKKAQGVCHEGGDIMILLKDLLRFTPEQEKMQRLNLIYIMVTIILSTPIKKSRI